MKNEITEINKKINKKNETTLNDTPSGERIHIALFGLRNAGKSSLANAITGQEISIVSEIKGTTTDPVKKAMELSTAGAVLIIDTPGLDDDGELGGKRAARAFEILETCDIAVFVHALDNSNGAYINKKELAKTFNALELEFLSKLAASNTPYLTVLSKADTFNVSASESEIESEFELELANRTEKIILTSAQTGLNIELLRTRLAEKCLESKLGSKKEKKLIADLLTPGDVVVLVMPIDKAAPKGRLILPQQQTIREILDAKCVAVSCQVGELDGLLKNLFKTSTPRMIITDSSVFKEVIEIVPPEIPLTSFSILFARYKGNLETFMAGAEHIKELKDGDKVLISEACTHCRVSGDIATEKLPKLLKQLSGAELEFSYTKGKEFPDGNELKKYELVVHCGGCMLTEKEMLARLERCFHSSVLSLNFGFAFAFPFYSYNILSVYLGKKNN